MSVSCVEDLTVFKKSHQLTLDLYSLINSLTPTPAPTLTSTQNNKGIT